MCQQTNSNKINAFINPSFIMRIYHLPLMERKLRPLSFARAFAIIVLEQPGGPYMRTPRGGLMPILVKTSGCLIGQSTAWFSFSLRSSRPPMSAQDTEGISTWTSRIALGFTRDRADRKCWRPNGDAIYRNKVVNIKKISVIRIFFLNGIKNLKIGIKKLQNHENKIRRVTFRSNLFP